MYFYSGKIAFSLNRDIQNYLGTSNSKSFLDEERLMQNFKFKAYLGCEFKGQPE